MESVRHGPEDRGGGCTVLHSVISIPKTKNIWIHPEGLRIILFPTYLKTV